MFEQLKAACERLQLDRSLAFVLASRVWQGLSGPITIFFVVRFLSQDQQGVYYGVFGFLAIQAFFELGLLNILVGYAGHQAAELGGDPLASDAAAQTKEAARRMSELIRASNCWFSVASCLFAIASFAFGWYTLSNAELKSPVHWQLPFAIVVPCAAVTVFFAPRLAILEGVGYRESIYKYRLLQAITGSFAVWATLTLGLGIWCLVAATATQLFWSWYICGVRYRKYFRQFETIHEKPTGFSWAQDILPAQWRMAAIGILHHVTAQYFTIIVLLFHRNAVDAGHLGMTLAVTGAIQMLAMAWVQTKYPVVAGLHGAGNRERAGTLWRQTAVVSTAMLVAAFCVFIGLVVALPSVDARFDGRFITPAQITVLGVGCIANHLIALQGFYVLSRRMEPLLVSIPGFTLAAAAVWGAGYLYSIDGIVCAYAFSLAMIVLPLHSWAYLKLRSSGTQQIA